MNIVQKSKENELSAHDKFDTV